MRLRNFAGPHFLFRESGFKRILYLIRKESTSLHSCICSLNTFKWDGEEDICTISYYNKRDKMQKGKKMPSHMTQNRSVLVTGGAGFIGSHTTVQLLELGKKVVIADDLSNSSELVLERIHTIVGDDAYQNLSFYRGDVCDTEFLTSIFNDHQIGSVIHFAGYKAVGESAQKPLEYYSNNLVSTFSLVKVMQEFNCKNLVFSSSATVYGDSPVVPLSEDAPKQAATNPYGWTKWMIEQVLTDVCAADPTFNVVLLRYFNPVGAHKSGLIGEDPQGIPNNLMPYISQVAVGIREKLHVFGGDYPTPDGTGVRDFIHVVDLAEGHLKALEWMQGKAGLEVFNLGTGKGSSVLDAVHAFEKACGTQIPYVIEERRPGDVAINFADPTKAQKLMGWKAQYNLDDMCEDAWRWQRNNPHGYSNDK